MADTPEVKKQEITVKHGGTHGQRFLFGADGKQHLLGPGQEAKIEVSEADARRLQEMARNGHGDLIVDGTDPMEARAEADKIEGAPEIPEEHSARSKVAEKELELMQAGQEAGKEAREKMAKKDYQRLAAETGIGIMSRGGVDALETVAAPPDITPEQVRARKK